MISDMVESPAPQCKARNHSYRLCPSSWDHLSLRQPAIQDLLPPKCGNSTLFGITVACVKGKASRISSAVHETKFNVAELIKLRSMRVENSVGCGTK